MGGIGKIFAGWGGPPSPPQEKNPALNLAIYYVKEMLFYSPLSEYNDIRLQNNEQGLLYPSPMKIH